MLQDEMSKDEIFQDEISRDEISNYQPRPPQTKGFPRA